MPKPPTVMQQVTMCSICKRSFSSRNALFRHLEEKNHFTDAFTPQKDHSITPHNDHSIRVVPPNSFLVSYTGDSIAFRGYNYSQIAFRTSLDGDDHLVVADSDCNMSSIDRGFLRTFYPRQPVRSIVPISIRGIGATTNRTSEVATLTFYLPGLKPGNFALGTFKREFHIIDDLPCKALIGNDILESGTMDKRTRSLKKASFNIGRLLQDPFAGNVVFIIQGPSDSFQKLYASKSILCANSDYFANCTFIYISSLTMHSSLESWRKRLKSKFWFHSQ
jgi:hypothetical protein